MGTAEFERDGSLVTVVLDGQPQSAVDVDDPTRLDFEYVQHFALAIDALAGDGPLRVTHIGGAGLTLARWLNHSRDGSPQIVLEPDAVLTDAVRRELPLPTGGLVLANVADEPGMAYTARIAAGARASVGHVALLGLHEVLKGKRFGNLVLVATAHPLDLYTLRRATASASLPTGVMGWDEIVRRRPGATPFSEATGDTAPSPPPPARGACAAADMPRPNRGSTGTVRSAMASSSLSRPMTAGVVSALVGHTSSFVVVLTRADRGRRDHDPGVERAARGQRDDGARDHHPRGHHPHPDHDRLVHPGIGAARVVGGGRGQLAGRRRRVLRHRSAHHAHRPVAPAGGAHRPHPDGGRPGNAGRHPLPALPRAGQGLAANPLAVAPVIVGGLLALRFLPRWSAPLAFVAAAVVIGVEVARSGQSVEAATLLPAVDLTALKFTLPGAVGLALPLYLVTMASQNVPGVAVMKGLGYEVRGVAPCSSRAGRPWRGTRQRVRHQPRGDQRGVGGRARRRRRPRPPLDRERHGGRAARRVGPGLSGAAALVLLAPEGVIAAVAGLALLATFATAMQAALADADDRMPAVLTFAVAASGLAIAGVSAAFWALVAGVVVRLVLRSHRRS